MMKHGEEKYLISVICDGQMDDVYAIIDDVLSEEDYDIISDEDEIKITIQFGCKWYHQDSFWDDHGGGPAEDEIVYTGSEPDDIVDALENALPEDVSVDLEYLDFISHM